MGENNNDQVWLDEEVTDKKKKKYIIIVAIIILLLITGSLFFYNANKKINSYVNKIYPGVTINGVDVGGKTKEDAKNLIEVNLLEQVKDKTITLLAGEKSIVVEYSKINPEYKVDIALNKALAMGKNESVLKQNSYIKKGIKQEVKVEFGYDEKVVDDYLTTLNKDVTVPAKNATLEVVEDKFNIVSAENGLELDVEKAKAILDENIDCDINIMDDKIEVPIREQLPKVTDELISEIDTKFGSASTSFNTGDWNRTENLKVATGNINGTVLMPGETFSYNEVVGERTTARGFKAGASFSGSEIVQSIGGGVCQISTTLYQAVMRSGIRSTERTNHSMRVGYANPSEDATVAWGYLDYKFKNIYDSPIFIQGIITDGIVTFNVFGNKEDIGNKTFELVGVTTGSVNPGSTRVNDSSLPAGTQIVERRPTMGTSSVGYLVTYEDGKEVSREEVSRDSYNSTPGVIRYGTGS
ncbi:MAG: VanW family protein [Sarcina sp.]